MKNRNFRTVILSLITIFILGVLTTSCGSDSSKKIKVGITGSNSKEWEYVKQEAAKKGIKLEIVYFSDYVQPNRALIDKELDINAFQTVSFLNTFNEYFQKNENPFYFFNILVKDSSNKLEFNEAIFLHFMPFFQEIKIKNKIDLIKNLNFQKQYDSYFEEDNPSSEFCCFNCHLNINQLFDQDRKSVV